MSHEKMELFSSFCLLCIFVSVTYIINAKTVFTPKRYIEAIKLWINKLDILTHHIQSFTSNCRICGLVMMLSRESTA